jgi:hypothetical protein
MPFKVIDPRTKKKVLGEQMPRTYLIFGDIEGKLDVLRVECTKCDRKGRYHVHKLIERYGRNGNMMKWRERCPGVGLSDLSGQPLGRRMALASSVPPMLLGFPALLNLPDRVNVRHRKPPGGAGECR